MELYKEILTEYLKEEKSITLLSNFKMEITQIVELECYKALQKIKAIIQDDRLEDKASIKLRK